MRMIIGWLRPLRLRMSVVNISVCSGGQRMVSRTAQLPGGLFDGNRSPTYIGETR